MNGDLTGGQAGLWAERLTDGEFTGRPVLFLDRDGVLVEEVNYLHRLEDVALIEGTAPAIARANAAGLPVVMVTNQAGIGRGYFDWQQFSAVQEHIFAQCQPYGAHYDMVLACAYHADGIPPFAEAAHFWRKPAPGMLLAAASALGADLAHSHMVGDTLSDLAAAEAAGLPAGSLVLTGHGKREWSETGPGAFARWGAAGIFEPRLFDSPGPAITRWLDEVVRPTDAA